ncbi:hypothetical protein FGRMN_11027 [Fusarium graminum]|nr:hypothetical protein FGRMN_11027 [Fusarium graminum]
MEFHPPSPTNNILQLPGEILIRVVSLADSFRDRINRVKICRQLYSRLILDVYKAAGKELKWWPMFMAAESGKIQTRSRCLEAGAPVDQQYLRTNPNVIKGDMPRRADGTPHLKSPLFQAVKATMAPSWCAYWLRLESWPQNKARKLCRYQLQPKAREMIKLLRQAGAHDHESLLDPREPDHLDSIESGEACCARHKIYEKPPF